MIRVKNKHNASSWLLTLGLVLALSIITSYFGLAWPSPIEAQATLPPRHDAFPVRDQPSGPVVHVPNYYTAPYVNNDYQYGYPVYYKR